MIHPSVRLSVPCTWLKTVHFRDMVTYRTLTLCYRSNPLVSVAVAVIIVSPPSCCIKLSIDIDLLYIYCAELKTGNPAFKICYSGTRRWHEWHSVTVAQRSNASHYRFFTQHGGGALSNAMIRPSVCSMPVAQKRCILGMWLPQKTNPMLYLEPTGQRSSGSHNRFAAIMLY